jgi:hypothetical protein
MALAAEQPAPSAFIDMLQSNKLYGDAVQTLARFLPKENAVQWAIESAQLAGERTVILPEEQSVLDVVAGWVANPIAANGEAAATAAADLPATSPAYWSAQAAAFAEGVEMPADGVPLDGGDNLTAHFAAGAVLLAAAKVSPGGVPELPAAPALADPQKAAVDADGLGTPAAAQMTPPASATPEASAQLAEAGKYIEPFLKLGLALAQTVPGWV